MTNRDLVEKLNRLIEGAEEYWEETDKIETLPTKRKNELETYFKGMYAALDYIAGLVTDEEAGTYGN